MHIEVITCFETANAHIIVVRENLFQKLCTTLFDTHPRGRLGEGHPHYRQTREQ